MQGPHYIFNGVWNIKPDGAITIDYNLKDWDNGDVGQRSFGLLLSQVDYYRYSGDPAAIGILTMTADNVLDNCLTPADHPWPKFFISCPTKGKAYYQADPHGFIQIDISAYVGSGLIGAYKITGNERYWETAKHWADLFAEHCNHSPGRSPWPRYANPEDVPPNGALGDWGPANVQTGSVALILRFLDDVIRTGYARQRRFAAQSPRRRRKIPSRRTAAEVEPRSDVRQLLLGLGQSDLYVRGRRLRLSIHDEPARSLSRLENRRSQHHVAELLPAERQSRVDGRRLLGRLGVSRVQQLLPHLAPVSDHGHRRHHSPNTPR